MEPFASSETFAVKDLQAAIDWYSKLLGRGPDARPAPEIAEWNFEDGRYLQLYELPESAGSGCLCLMALAETSARSLAVIQATEVRSIH